jgi:hypothetical protein
MQQRTTRVVQELLPCPPADSPLVGQCGAGAQGACGLARKPDRNNRAVPLSSSQLIDESPRWHEGRLWFAHWLPTASIGRSIVMLDLEVDGAR